jgi:TonB family protein
MVRVATFPLGWCAVAAFFLVATVSAQLQPPLQGAESDGPAPAKVYHVGNGVSPPQEVSAPSPTYPETARKEGYYGTCVLTLVVDSDGLPRDLKVVRPLGMGLDDKALEAAHQGRFKPATKGGMPVAVKVNIEISFHL